MMKERKKLIVSTAVAGLMTLASSASLMAAGKTAPTKAETGQCYGVNSCKGQSACTTAKNMCAGQNSCKGQGWMKMTKKQCAAKKGSFKKAS